MTRADRIPWTPLPNGIDKNRPPAAWISALRGRFRTEAAIDRLLTRKLERRGGPGFTPLPLDTLASRIESLLQARIGSDFRVSDVRWLSGGASKLQVAFTLDWNRPDIGRERTPMVLRMEPAESIVETSRLREYQLIQAMTGTVPVPPVFWCDEDGEYLPYPSLIYGFAQGVTRPTGSADGVSGLGTQMSPELRRQLAPQFVECLAKIHGFDFRAADLSAFEVPEAGTTQCALWGMDWWDRVWEEDADEEVPLMRLASGWLRRNPPRLDRPVIVHADYRVGNFLFTEHDSKISAWLDWELGRIGDRHQDLAWTTSAAFASLDTDGKTPLVCGLLPEAAFFESYERAANTRVDRRALNWYQIYNNYSLSVMLMATSARIARNGKTHQDVLLAWLMGIGATVLEHMRSQLEQAA